MWDFGSKKAKRLQILKQQFGTKPDNSKMINLEDISLYYNLMKEQISAKVIDDITWNDLEMDLIFARINSTNCYIGEQILYSRLHLPRDEDANAALENRIEYLTQHENERLELQDVMQSIGKEHENYYLPMFLLNADHLSSKGVWIYRLLQFLLFGSFFGAIFTSSVLLGGIMICTALVNLIIYLVNKVRYESCLFSLINTKDMVALAKMLISEPKYTKPLGADHLRTAVTELNRLTRLIGIYQSKKKFMWTADVLDILRDYIIGITLWDLSIFQKLTNIIYGKLDYLLEIYEFIGELDMAVSIASFRKSLPYYCLPQQNSIVELNMQKIYHPLIDEPVSNDLLLKQSCIITGSNASGKSTFIKAVAVNAILAQSINTCMAESFQLPVLNVMTSMTVRDDILAGESFYIKELQYLKRIVDDAAPNTVTLCIIDEILRGTNTQERLASSEAILKYLAERNCLVIVATHDMELAKALEGSYRCLHFCNHIEDEKIVFDYKIQTGYSQTQNAIKLLHQIGFPELIVEMAEKLYNDSR